MKKFTISIIGSVLLLTGCASSQEYAMYAETQKAIAQANAQAHAMSESARYAALAEIAKNGDATARVAAAMSLSLGSSGQVNRQLQNTPVNPPVSFGDRALQWSAVLVPSLTNLYGINANRQVAITQSNNQAAVAQSTNNTFATMNTNMANSNTAIANNGLATASTIATNGLTAATTIANSGLTATTNVANTGIGQVGTTAAAGLTAVTAVNASSNTAITNVSNTANASIQAISATIPLIQPNVTTNTTTTTTNNNLTCPAGQTLTNGSCQ